MWRQLAIVLLVIAVAGLGLCSLTSALFAFQMPQLFMLTALTAVLAWGGIVGIRRLRRGGKDAVPPPAP